MQSAGWVLGVERVEGDGRRVLSRQQEPDCQQSQTQTGACIQENDDTVCLQSIRWSTFKEQNVDLKWRWCRIQITHLKDCRGSASCGPLSLQARLPPRWTQSWSQMLQRTTRLPAYHPEPLPSAEWLHCSTLKIKWKSSLWSQIHFFVQFQAKSFAWKHHPLLSECRQVWRGAIKRHIEDLHDGVYSRQLLKHLEATADDQSPASRTVAEDPQNYKTSYRTSKPKCLFYII